MKLKEAMATETFISDGGYYVISQTGYSEESIVLLSLDQIRHIIKNMRQALKTSKEWWIDNKQITEEQHDLLVSLMKLKKLNLECI